MATTAAGAAGGGADSRRGAAGASSADALDAALVWDTLGAESGAALFQELSRKLLLGSGDEVETARQLVEADLHDADVLSHVEQITQFSVDASFFAEKRAPRP